MEGASRNLEQRKNSEFIVGHPEAVLLIELKSDDPKGLFDQAGRTSKELERERAVEACPILTTMAQQQSAWELRKAGLGMVANVVGDTKPVTVIEDTAVATSRLHEYIDEVDRWLKEKYDVRCVHYAHAGAGEIHLRPLLNLKTDEGRQRFRSIASDIANLVKKYGGSLSGEHGDGRLRAEFLEKMVGDKNYQLMREVKSLWDPTHNFNPGKIVDAPAMDESLRVDWIRPAKEWEPHELDTVFNFDKTQGYFRATEMCSGSGDCRKTHLSGGTMCPSYMATRREDDSTRGRANLLRHSLANPQERLKPFDDSNVVEILDLCLSCKGCKNECPSNVDMARLKSEYMQQYYDVHGVPAKTRRFANFVQLLSKAKWFPAIANWLGGNRITGTMIKKWLGVHPKRSLPKIAKHSFAHWFQNRSGTTDLANQRGEVVLFCDEFINLLEPSVGIAATELLEHFGFRVNWMPHPESARAALSKGLVRQAKRIAEQNVRFFENQVNQETPLIGLEPSAILTFRDEYPELVSDELQESAKKISDCTFLIDEFLAKLKIDGVLDSDYFHDQPAKIQLHGHCHQKALSSVAASYQILSLPRNYEVEVLKTGCCGMAGSFGMEVEHYDLSMQIGELVLFPALRANQVSGSKNEMIAAPGISCRHQILDGVGLIARHPVELLRDALRSF